jgi:hypothetical protein
MYNAAARVSGSGKKLRLLYHVSREGLRWNSLVVLIHRGLAGTDTGIRYDTYQIRGYVIFQKTLIRGYGLIILIIIIKNR